MRKKMVTRTITTTNVLVMCVNIVEGTTTNISITLPGVYGGDEKKMLKAVGEVPAGDGSLKPVHIISTEEMETLYGMEEKLFIEHAQILPSRGEKSKQENGTAEA